MAGLAAQAPDPGIVAGSRCAAAEYAQVTRFFDPGLKVPGLPVQTANPRNPNPLRTEFQVPESRQEALIATMSLK